MKRRNDDAQVSRAEHARREHLPPQQPGSFPLASPTTQAARRTVALTPSWRARAAAPLAADAYAARVRKLNAQFSAWATAQLAADPGTSIADAARDYVNYAKRLEDRFLHRRTDVLSFGSGDCGQLAHSETLEDERDTVVARPRVVLALRDKQIAQLSCGGLHNVACTADGRCYTWGCNDEGSLGRLGKEEELYLPGVVALDDPIVAVAAGGSQTFAVTKQGAVYGWGCYKDKEGKQWFDPASPAAPDCKRKQTSPLRIAGLDGVVAMSCGACFNAAVTVAGDCLTWGFGEIGQLGRPVPPVKKNDAYDFAAIAADHLTPAKLEMGGACKAVGCGAFHLLAATSTGLVACGLNNYGQVGDGTTTDAPAPVPVPALADAAIAQLGGGEHHSLALLGDGSVYAWGRADYGQLGLGDKDELGKAGASVAEPRHVASLNAVDAVACGDHHCLALASNKIYAWGYGDMNALGLGKEGSDRFAPEVVTVKLDGGAVATAFTQVAGGGQHSMVVAAVEGRA